MQNKQTSNFMAIAEVICTGHRLQFRSKAFYVA